MEPPWGISYSLMQERMKDMATQMAALARSRAVHFSFRPESTIRRIMTTTRATTRMENTPLDISTEPNAESETSLVTANQISAAAMAATSSTPVTIMMGFILSRFTRASTPPTRATARQRTVNTENSLKSANQLIFLTSGHEKSAYIRKRMHAQKNVEHVRFPTVGLPTSGSRGPDECPSQLSRPQRFLCLL